MRRNGLRDGQWERIKDFLPGREGYAGGTAADNRLFVEAIIYRYRAGIPWRDLPKRFGDWKALGNPVALSLTPGQASGICQAEPLLDEVDPKAFLAGKAYDADALIETLEQRGIEPVIPSKANGPEPRDTGFALYRERNPVERFFKKNSNTSAPSSRATTSSRTHSLPPASWFA